MGFGDGFVDIYSRGVVTPGGKAAVMTGVRGDSCGEPRNTVGVGNDRRGFLWPPAFFRECPGKFRRDSTEIVVCFPWVHVGFLLFPRSIVCTIWSRVVRHRYFILHAGRVDVYHIYQNETPGAPYDAPLGVPLDPAGIFQEISAVPHGTPWNPVVFPRDPAGTIEITYGIPRHTVSSIGTSHGFPWGAPRATWDTIT